MKLKDMSSIEEWIVQNGGTVLFSPKPNSFIYFFPGRGFGHIYQDSGGIFHVGSIFKKINGEKENGFLMGSFMAVSPKLILDAINYIPSGENPLHLNIEFFSNVLDVLKFLDSSKGR